MKKKIIEIIIFLLVTVLFITIGYYIYQSYTNKKEDQNKTIEIDNYYSEEYLFNNDYIKIASTISDFSEEAKEVYMCLDVDNVLYIKYTNEKTKLNKKISNLPKEKVTVYYNNLYDNYYEFTALTENNEIYYIALDITSKKDYKFKKIGENIKEVYIPTYDKEKVYVSDNPKSNFIFASNNQELKYISKEKKEYFLKTNVEKTKPYFDYVCASNTLSICNDIMIYQTFTKTLIPNYTKEEIKNQKGEEIFAREMFSVLEIDAKKEIDLNKVTYKDLTKKYNYIFTTYIIDEEGKIYEHKINKETIENKENPNATIYSEKVVNKIEYEEKDNQIQKVQIIYIDGTKHLIESKINKTIITSTIYDKSKLKEEIIVPEL